MESKDNNIQDKINRDAFSESIRKKMENHTMPVDADVWKSVSSTLPARNKRIPVWLLYSLSAAASLALIFTVGFQFFVHRDAESTPATVKVQRIDNQSDKMLSAETVTSATDGNFHITPKQSKPVATTLLIASADSVIPGIPVVHQETTVVQTQNPVVQTQNPVISQQDQPIAVHTPDPVSSEIEKASRVDEESLSKALQEQVPDWTDQMKKADQKSMQLAANLGSGAGGASASRLGSSMEFMAADLAPVRVKAANIMKAEDFRNRDYLPPVTIGARISYPLSSRFSVETGLSYTWLMTRLNESYWGNYQASLSLHYLGIPLNFRTTCFQSGKWNVYASAGTMLEKGLWSEYQQFQDWGTAEYRTEASQKIDGFQWSVQAAAGVEYRYSKQLNFYFEPGIAYYFENEQPFSIRTEMPLLLVLNAGIRFKI